MGSACARALLLLSRMQGSPRHPDDDHPKAAIGMKPCTKPDLAGGQVQGSNLTPNTGEVPTPGIAYVISRVTEIPQCRAGNATAAELEDPKL